MNIDSIQNGIVLDHITAGKGMEIYHDLGLEKLDCSVAIMQAECRDTVLVFRMVSYVLMM